MVTHARGGGVYRYLGGLALIANTATATPVSLGLSAAFATVATSAPAPAARTRRRRGFGGRCLRRRIGRVVRAAVRAGVDNSLGRLGRLLGS